MGSHTDDYAAMSISSEPIVGGKAAAEALSVQLENVTTVHHGYTPVIDCQGWDNATGVWAVEDNLFWMRNGEKPWLRGFSFYHETYVRGEDGRRRFNYRKLERTHAETSPEATVVATDFSGENLLVGIG
jgi:SnoaL-like domain